MRRTAVSAHPERGLGWHAHDTTYACRFPQTGLYPPPFGDSRGEKTSRRGEPARADGGLICRMVSGGGGGGGGGGWIRKLKFLSDISYVGPSVSPS